MLLSWPTGSIASCNSDPSDRYSHRYPQILCQVAYLRGLLEGSCAIDFERKILGGLRKSAVQGRSGRHINHALCLKIFLR